jgi:hypothetical protein
MIEIKIQKSNGRGKNGKLHVYIIPDYYCYNKSRKASGFYKDDLQDSINFVLRKWYQPELFVYEIEGKTVVSNNEKNALTEYWRVCERSDIGKEFPVKLMTGSHCSQRLRLCVRRQRKL